MTKNQRLQPVNPEDISDILRDVRESRCFGRSQRQLQLFEYLLEHSRADTKVAPTQYSIALDVIGRPESFDASTDSIVRVEMHRLRTNLDVYNNSEAKYEISVPPASFFVSAVLRKSTSAAFLVKNFKMGVFAIVGFSAAVSVALASIGPSLPVSTQTCANDRPNLYIEYAEKPTRAHGYVKSVLRSAISQQTVFNLIDSVQSCGSDAAPSYDLQINLLESEGRFNLSLNVLERLSKTVIESHHLTGMTADARPGTDLYYKITETANSIALPSGTVARDAYGRNWGIDAYRKGYSCLVSMYDSYAGEQNSEFENVVECLERSIADGGASLDNYGALASIYLYEARNAKTSTAPDPFRAAENILDEYDDKWMDSSEIAIAKIYYEAYRSDFNSERLFLILDAVQSKFSTNPQVLLNVAVFYGFSLGKWNEAKEISDHVKSIYSVRDQSVYAADAGYALMVLSDGGDMQPCYDFYNKTSAFTNIIVNSCARLAGDDEWLNKTEANLAALNLANSLDRLNYLNRHSQHDAFISKVAHLQTQK